MMKHLPLAILVIGGCGIAAVTGLRFLGQQDAVAAPVISTSNATTAQPPDPLDTLSNASLFGAVDAPKESATPTKLPPLRLVGVLASSKAENSKALIETTTGLEVFFPGDVVAAPFKLTQVGDVSVTLSDGAIEHILQFETLMAGAGIPSGTDASTEVFRTAAHRALSAKPKKPETTAEYIDYWRDRVRRNPGEVLRDIGLEPADGGYRIAAKQDIGVRLAGFRTGDLITSVNGMPVGVARQDRKNMDQIIADGMARISFERNGEQRTLTFPLR